MRYSIRKCVEVSGATPESEVLRAFKQEGLSNHQFSSRNLRQQWGIQDAKEKIE